MGEVTWFAGPLDALLKGSHGPVAVDLGRRCYRVRGKALGLCPVDIGRLRSSINISLGHDAEGAYGDIGSNVEYTIFVHQGTRYMEGRPFLTDALPAANE